jgi:josephin
MHSLNALVQDEGLAVTRAELDSIADTILETTLAAGAGPCCAQVLPSVCVRTCCHPHRGPLGNYDVNVLMAALEERGLEAQWYDKRHRARSIDYGRSELVGFLINGENFRFGMRMGRHWWAIRRIRGRWFNLDSLRNSPSPYPEIPALRDDLQRALDDDGQVLLILRKPAISASAGGEDGASSEPVAASSAPTSGAKPGLF